MFKKKKCLNCNKIYIPTSGNSKYCLNENCQKLRRKKNNIKYRKSIKNINYVKRYNKEHCEKIKLRKAKRYNKNKNNKQYQFNKYKSNAIARNLQFELTIDNFKKYWKQPCYYCGDKIETIGLDRVNNDKGYTIDNVVSCCAICNYMKRNLSKEDFINKCKKIVNNYK